jgi:hypothetical protein
MRMNASIGLSKKWTNKAGVVEKWTTMALDDPHPGAVAHTKKISR